MYRTNDLSGLKLIRKKNEIIFLNNNKYLYYQAAKGFVGKKITNETSYIWINYFIETENKKITIQFFKELDDQLKKTVKNEKIQPFYLSNGFGASIQKWGDKQMLDCYITKDIKLELEDCPDKFYMSPLIWIQNARYVQDRWYINIKLVQAIIFPIFIRFKECLIEEIVQYNTDKSINKLDNLIKTKENKVRYSEHPIYGKYFKMISMGIPIMAVQIKIGNELGKDKVHILNNKADDLIEIEYIKQIDHKQYAKYFKMLKLGIPRIVVEQKMKLEMIEPKILDEPDKIVFNLELLKNDFMIQLTSQKLKRRNDEKKSEKDKNKIHNLIGSPINMDELLKKRELILNK